MRRKEKKIIVKYKNVCCSNSNNQYPDSSSEYMLCGLNPRC